MHMPVDRIDICKYGLNANDDRVSSDKIKSSRDREKRQKPGKY